MTSGAQPKMTSEVVSKASAGHNQKITPEVVAEHGFKGDEYQRLLGILGREPTFLGDVVGALLL
jgi:hypothetical protein